MIHPYCLHMFVVSGKASRKKSTQHEPFAVCSAAAASLVRLVQGHTGRRFHMLAQTNCSSSTTNTLHLLKSPRVLPV